MSLSDLPKAYEPKAAQERWYRFWLEKGYFHADPTSDRPHYTIVIPPPNVTGALHLGHALNNTLQDILIRRKRMQGFDALWMPGTDHAGIATQAVVERRLFEEEKKTRHDIGREALVARIWAWKDEYEARILSQLRLMGCSCDWDRTRFTLDEGCSRAVRETFFRLFQAGKIFRGKRLVNWDTQLRTAVADDEIYTEEIQGKLWYIRYPVAGSNGESLTVATTRPETMLGDTAVAVHPEDERYKHLIGKNAVLPLLGREIPIIADSILVDRELGTGCVKVTPAHDPNDYATGLRHGLPMIDLMNPDGSYNENAGPYAGLDRWLVRKRVLEDLKSRGLLLKEEVRVIPMKYSDRSKTPIEWYRSDQWFVRMADDADGTPGFAQQAMDAVTSGRLRITPERYAKSYLDWLGEKRDWCISRQLWWGHRVPVWSVAIPLDDQTKQMWHGLREMEDKALKIGRPDIAAEFARRTELSFKNSFPAYSSELEERFGDRAAFQLRLSDDGNSLDARCCVREKDSEIEDFLQGLGYAQDPDVLDTWFSSALWPHSTLGWPDETPELAKYYPTSVLSTARDIITLWVARMVIFGQFNMGDVPFRDVYIHPVIQDGQGRRMSKSLGNGVDPVDIIDLYGADALRYTLASLATETQDLRIPVEKTKLPDGREVNTSERFEQGRTFPNKLWNASRFALMNLEGYEPGALDPKSLPVEDRWILDLLATTTEETSRDLDAFRFAEATRRLRDFTWNDVCDWYIEFIKARLREPSQRANAQRVLAAVLDGLCRMLHPVMPFVTEQVWQALNDVAPVRGIPEPAPAVESVCVAPWPSYPTTAWSDPAARAAIETWRAAITAIRNLRAERNVPPATKIAPLILAGGEVAETLHRGQAFIRSLTNAETLEIGPDLKRPAEAATAVLPDAEIILPLAGLIDKQAELDRQRKALADLDKQIEALERKLANSRFAERAPAEVVAQTRAKLADLIVQRGAVAALVTAG